MEILWLKILKEERKEVRKIEQGKIGGNYDYLPTIKSMKYMKYVYYVKT